MLDQFVLHTRHLKALNIERQYEHSETDRPNVLEFASRIIEEQDEPVLQELTLSELSSASIEEPTEEDKRLINAVLQSGITELTTLSFSKNASWFCHSDMKQYLLEFI